MHKSRKYRAFAFVTVVTMAPICLAQNTDPPQAHGASGNSNSALDYRAGDWLFRTWLRAEHTFDTSVDGGGNYENTSGRFQFSAETLLRDDLHLRLTLNYGADLYEFSGTTGFGGVDPWDEVQRIGVNGRVTWSVSDEWAVFGGADVLSWREQGADFGKSWTGGGLIGATYLHDDDLQVGLGIFFANRLEKGALLIPAIYVHWQINEHWRLSTQDRIGLTGATGMEIVYDIGGTSSPPRTWRWSMALGGRWEMRRFRLADDGSFPDGVGDETAFPIWGRISVDVNRTLSMDIYGGARLGTKLAMADSFGNTQGEANADSGPFFGLSLRLRF